MASEHELRIEALRMAAAHESAAIGRADFSAEQIIKHAETYYDFLMGRSTKASAKKRARK